MNKVLCQHAPGRLQRTIYSSKQLLPVQESKKDLGETVRLHLQTGEASLSGCSSGIPYYGRLVCWAAIDMMLLAALHAIDGCAAFPN